MYYNVISYAHGLLDELDSAVRAGWDTVASEVRAELDRIRPEVKAVDVQSLDDDGKASLASLNERLAALAPDGGDKPERAEADETPVKGGRARTAKAASAPETAVPAKPE